MLCNCGQCKVELRFQGKYIIKCPNNHNKIRYPFHIFAIGALYYAILRQSSVNSERIGNRRSPYANP